MLTSLKNVRWLLAILFIGFVITARTQTALAENPQGISAAGKTNAVRKRIAFIIGENEYRTWETLPEFAQQELVKRGYEVGFATASQQPEDFDFKNWAVVTNADLLVVSARRRAMPPPMAAALRAHVAAGKGVVGLRTASHAFDPKDKSIGAERTWRAFDAEVLGGNYKGHYSSGVASIVRVVSTNAAHPILNNVRPEFRTAASLYKNPGPLAASTILLEGRRADGQSATEPVAWVNTTGNRRVFYTSLGGPEDFKDENFRKLLLNGMLWGLGDVIPPATTR